MAEVDTSSYPRAAAMPVAKSPIEQMQQYQTLERGNTALSQEKLNLINTQFQLMNNELADLAAGNYTKEQAAQRLNTFAKTYKFPAEVTQHMTNELAAAPNVKTFAETAIRRGLGTIEKINQTYGTPSVANSGSKEYRGVTTPPMMPGAGGFRPATQMAVQPPPTTPVQDEEGRPGIVGPAGPDAVQPYTPTPRARPRMPLAAPATTGPTGPTINNGTEFDNRFGAAFPNAVATGPAPGTAGAVEAKNAQSGEDYATDLRRLRTYQADLQPDLAVLNIVKGKAANEFGPGTDLLNQAKKIAATWLPNVDPNIINSASDYDTVKKYLVQGARSSGNTGSNDQLAAAFSANPNTTMQTATIEDIVKSRVALRKMEAGQTLLFGQQGKKPSEYSEWVAKNQNVLDPRAFGWDLMSDEARDKVLSQIATKDKKGDWIAKKGKEKEFRRLDNSIGFANDAGLIEPPGRKQ